MTLAETPRMKPTDAAYQDANGALTVDRNFYRSVAASAATEVDSFTIPIRSGRAWEVPAGHLCRIVAVEGPQVGDLTSGTGTIRGNGCGRPRRASCRPPTCRRSTTTATPTSRGPCCPTDSPSFDVHDVHNVFQVTGLNSDDRYYIGDRTQGWIEASTTRVPGVTILELPCAVQITTSLWPSRSLRQVGRSPPRGW
jgi:hypothetical protein